MIAGMERVHLPSSMTPAVAVVFQPVIGACVILCRLGEAENLAIGIMGLLAGVAFVAALWGLVFFGVTAEVAPVEGYVIVAVEDEEEDEKDAAFQGTVKANAEKEEPTSSLQRLRTHAAYRWAMYLLEGTEEWEPSPVHPTWLARHYLVIRDVRFGWYAALDTTGAFLSGLVSGIATNSYPSCVGVVSTFASLYLVQLIVILSTRPFFVPITFAYAVLSNALGTAASLCFVVNAFDPNDDAVSVGVVLMLIITIFTIGKGLLDLMELLLGTWALLCELFPRLPCQILARSKANNGGEHANSAKSVEDISSSGGSTGGAVVSLQDAVNSEEEEAASMEALLEEPCSVGQIGIAMPHPCPQEVEEAEGPARKESPSLLPASSPSAKTANVGALDDKTLLVLQGTERSTTAAGLASRQSARLAFDVEVPQTADILFLEEEALL